ncbi:PAS domain S-box-containing protein/diguanylate cyclase (GGDEF)-like protein [Sphingomonas vulcanisoli]|uniref:PAS domain S-box-containing protein/diguanylate cyclase (GGDEF)-like protein n=1 Tax=Sphingomonas vulcanisoli TaxID=1658060 RepID=A0ABX0TU34_9SPHN|nr:bifunctional diguanylate cyclase/phosphodiesterase [Sphingomonas vulcanisoli]NIJ07669.1 PAS domain S-box-containing protein/diguanylate cyclase (GGDEF)-like protein [Sphingomonas vulcanisoli]
MSAKFAAKAPIPAILEGTLADIAIASIRLIPDAIVVADMRERDAPLIWVSEQFSAITGYTAAEAIGKNCRYLQGSDRLQSELGPIREALASGTSATVTMRNYRKDGTLFWNELTLTPYSRTEGVVEYYVGLMRDVTAAKRSLDQAVDDARLDRLTNLPNRYSFLEDVEKIDLPDNSRLLVVKIDIAELHNINSTYGYAAGDEIICKTASRLSSLSPDALGRIGNNEFAAAFRVPTAAAEEKTLAQLTAALRPPFTTPDAIINIRYALGYTVGDLGPVPGMLSQQAGQALHESKDDPHRAPRRFDEAAERASRHRSRLTAELQQAVRDENFVYHYQPQFDLLTGKIIGCEALIRWDHPVFGLQGPDTFIGVAEETGLIVDIERAGIRKVAAFAAELNASLAEPLHFSVNVSPLEIVRGDLVGLIEDVVAETGIKPAWLTFELTESLLTDSSESVIAIFRRLRELGVGLAIDDFGTGYSSLRSIDRFPISEIKIDRSFTQDLRTSQTKRILVEAIVALGKALSARVVAEGIETVEQKEELKEMGCLFGQGYLFSHPLPAEELVALTRTPPNTVVRNG